MQRRAIQRAGVLLGLTPLMLCRMPGTKGFAVLPRPQVAAGTFDRWRCLSKDHGRLPEVSGATATLAMLRLTGVAPFIQTVNACLPSNV